MSRPESLPPSVFLDSPGDAPQHSSEAYQGFIARLFAMSRNGSRFGLTPMREALALFAHPERQFRSVHVAGSNGKGSTSSFLASILSQKSAPEGEADREAHPPIGLYTSPHLIDMTERIQSVRLSRYTCFSETRILEVAARIEAKMPGFEGLSFFEVISLLAFMLFEEAGLQTAVVEAGLGARLDATRLVEADLAVLTDLSLEHTEILGDTLEAIAAEEGAVMRPGKPLVYADGDPSAMAVIDRMVAEAEVQPFRLGREFRVEMRPHNRIDLDLQGLDARRRFTDLELSLLGPHQARNAALAAQAALLFDPELDETALRRGLKAAVWPGRLERFQPEGSPPVVLDGAQNAAAAHALAKAVVQLQSEGQLEGPIHVVFGVLSDKDAPEMLAALRPLAEAFYLTRPSSKRARAPQELLAHLPTASVIEDPLEALQKAQDAAKAQGGWVLVCGSLYLVGGLRASLLGDCLPNCYSLAHAPPMPVAFACCLAQPSCLWLAFGRRRAASG